MVKGTMMTKRAARKDFIELFYAGDKAEFSKAQKNNPQAVRREWIFYMNCLRKEGKITENQYINTIF